MKNVLSVAVALLTTGVVAAPKPVSFKYTTVEGFFQQDDLATNPTGYDYRAQNFGLLNRTYPSDTKEDVEGSRPLTQWQRFAKHVRHLNWDSNHQTTQYKVLFMGRHGEGFHNAAESYFGTPAWNCYWSLLDGNSTTTWADALVTEEGVRQVKIAAQYWEDRVKVQKIHVPEVFYTSPLSRCLETARLTFGDLKLPKPFVPIVKENFREGASGHTCDRRRSKTYIQETYPGFAIEEGFTEEDQLFRPLLQEPAANQDIRSKIALDQILFEQKNTWVSITSHSGEITSLLRVLNHRPFRLATGGIIPVLVKVERIFEEPPPTTTLAWGTISTCASAPATATPTV